MWTPPKKCKLSIWLSPRDRSASPDWSKFLSLGFKNSFRGIHVELALGSPKLPAIIDLMSQRLGQRDLDMKWSLEEPPLPVPDSGGWFVPLMGGAEADNALKLRKDVHFGYIRFGEECQFQYAYAASDKFMDAVKSNSLRGLESLPLPPAGKRPQTGWSQVWASKPMGRGLDHPAADSAAVEAAFPEDPAWPGAMRYGESWVRGSMLDVHRVNHPQLVQLAPLGEASVRGHDIFVAEHVPNDVDFAYHRWTRTDDGREKHRWRSLLMSRRAKDTLIAAGLIRESHIDPVEVVPKALAQNPILDEVIKEPLPLPVYTPSEAAAERERREQMVKKLAAPPARRKPPSLKQCQAALKAAAKEAGVPTLADDAAQMRAIEKSKLFAKLPASWQELLPAVPARLIGPDQPEADLWIACAPEPAAFTADSDVRARPAAERPSAKDIVIGTTAFGDWYAIRSDDPSLPRDAAVRLWSHDTMYPTQVWDTVADFASYLVEAVAASK